ncbi:MAG: hypothetical protein RLO04_11155 [Limnobacter sp.]|uniref:hypothetical protein n=1 Tax=Limnobacter sp. TaxID=2003368 RepID=UPI0032EF3F76
MPKFIEVGQVTTRAIDHEAKDLRGERLDGQSLAVLANAAKKPFQVRKKGDVFEVASEVHKATTGSEAVRSGVNKRDSMLRQRAILGAVPDIGHNPLGVAWDLYIRTFKSKAIRNSAQRFICIMTS